MINEHDWPAVKFASTPTRDAINIWQVHLPVLCMNAQWGLAKPIVYGTAFPIAPGLFVTAAHVIEDARADGEPVLSVMTPGVPARVHKLRDIALNKGIDLALLACDGLAHLPAIPLEFDRRLRILEPVFTIGFPHAEEPEFYQILPRAFTGTVIARRELHHLPGQPVGFEVSFFAPRGLSGAPLVSQASGQARCYGWVIQQGTLGGINDDVRLSFAVSIELLLNVVSLKWGGPLATVLGRKVQPRLPMSSRKMPLVFEKLDEGWPDDPPSESTVEIVKEKKEVPGDGADT